MRFDPPPLPADWQRTALRTMLRLNSGALFLLPLVSVAITGNFLPYFWLIEAAGICSLLLTKVAVRSYRVVAFTYLLVLFSTVLTLGYHQAWSPSVVATLCYLSVAAGLLFGRRGLVIVAVTTIGTLEFGGWLVLTGRFTVPYDPVFDPSQAKNWLRLSVLFVLIVGIATWALRSVLEGAHQVEAAARAALHAAHERLSAAMRLRTDRLSKESAVRRSQRLQMVAHLGEGFAHLLNNMLTVVRSVCEDLRAVGDPAAIRQAAKDIREVVEECTGRTQEMLVMSRTTEESFAAVALDRALTEGFAKLTEKLRTNIRCEIAVAPCGVVELPRLWLDQILTNLLLNAAQALPEGGHIRVETSMVVVTHSAWSTIDVLAPGRYAVLSVSDDGCGMTAEVAERACEPFFSTRSPTKHAGLGLTLVHGMAKQIGGSIELRRLEKGTQVLVYLPVAESGAAAHARTGKAPSEHSASVVAQTFPTSPSTSAAVPATGDRPLERAPVASEPLAPPPKESPHLVWQERGLNLIIRVVGAVLFIMASVSLRIGDRQIAIAYFAGSLGLVGITLFRRLPYGIRLWSLLVTTMGLVLIVIANGSLLTPSPMAGLAATAYLAAIYGTRRTILGTLAGIAFCLAAAGWWWTQDYHHAPIDRVMGHHAANWFRIGFTLPVVITLIAVAVLRVVSTARARAVDLERARQELDRSHAVYEAETAALLRIEETRSRASRMEVGGLLTGMLAHDLNNSLGAILGWTDLLEYAGSTEEITEALTTIVRSADYAEALVQHLQQRTNMDHRDHSLDLAAALGRMQPMLAAVANKAKVAVAVAIDADPDCFVAIREHSLRRLVLNLVTNARDACGERGGHCTIRLKQEGATVRLEAADDGCGMDEATRARLFEAFFTTKGTRGTGLGLHSVMEIVSGTDGAIDVWSEPGVGTRLTIRWPLAAAPATTGPVSDKPPTRGGRARVLLVEDHATIRRVMVRSLGRAGYAVHEAADGDEAMKHLHAGTFDLLCTDAVMPGQPLAGLIQRFHEIQPGGPIFVVSGYLPEGLLAQLPSNEQVHILFKPITAQQLVQAFETQLNRQSA